MTEYGALWTTLRINHAGRVRCEPDWNWSPPPRTFVDFDLWYVWAGRGRLDLCNGPPEEVSAGSLMCFRPHQPPHGAEHDPADRLGVCYIHFDFLDSVGKPIRDMAESALPPVCSRLAENGHRPFVELTIRRVVELFLARTDPARREAECYLEGLVRGLCAGLGDNDDGGVHLADSASVALADARRRIDEVVRHVRENPAETFSMRSLAAMAHYSPDHFSRLFTSVHGKTPKEFCIAVRLERASQLLTESDLTVDQIARSLGYQDVFFFSRQFKARLGLAPTAWRAATRR